MVVVAFASGLIGLGAARDAALAAPRALPGCPGYASAMAAAQDALRRGDKPAALRKLREARAMLESCGSRDAERASAVRALASRAVRATCS